MNENEKKSGDWKLIIGGIILIVVMFAAIKLVFWGLGKAIPRTHPAASVSASIPDVDQSELDSPRFCVHCGKELPESFRWGQFCPYCGEKVE